MEKIDLISIPPKKDSFSNFACHGKSGTYDIKQHIIDIDH